MIDEVHDLLDRYAQWLRDKSVLREVDDQYVEITTPYLDRHNDYTQIYVRRDNGAFLLTDGDTIQDLRASGCDLDTAKRRELLTAALNGFGIRREGDALQVRATAQEFPLRKHNLVQAMLAVNDLELHDIRFTPNVKFTGRSGYGYTFDFVVPASRRAPERLIRAVNRPSRDLAESLAFSWVDTREVRPPASKCYAFLNDEHRAPTPAIVDALRNYDIVPVVWSTREAMRQELAA